MNPLLVFLLSCTAALYEIKGENELRSKLEDQQPDYPVEEYLENCGMTHTVIHDKSFKFVTPYYGDFQYPNGVWCNWTFIGYDTCTPTLSCNEVDLRPNPSCSQEFIEVTDGIGGSLKICDKADKYKLENVRSSGEGRDLFVALKTMDGGFKRKFNGIFCQVRCNGAGVQLPRESLPWKEESRCVCGLQNSNDRIVNGKDSKLNEFPWMAAVVETGTRKPKCGAALINNRWAVSAAHCFQFFHIKASEVEVLFHAHTLDFTFKPVWADRELGEKGSIRGPGWDKKQMTDEDEETTRHKVVEIINHPMFTAKYDYDIALLRLSPEVDLKAPNAPTPVCLPTVGSYNETFPNQLATVIGWGLPHQDAGASTRVLQKLQVPVISLPRCQKMLPQPLTQRMLCAGFEEGGKDSCTGDSGGPLVINSNGTNQWTQIGIVSWGEGCAQKQRPGVYSRLTELIQWVRKETKGSTWCRQHLK